MDANEQKVLDDIAAHGCHILHVLEEGELPPFSYSVGIHRSCGAAELIVVGLKQPIAQWVINEYNRRVRQGEAFAGGTRANGFLEGFEVSFCEVHPSHYAEYLGWGRWLYKGDRFPALQLVWPTTAGIWPWDADASAWFRSWQPMLDAPDAGVTEVAP